MHGGESNVTEPEKDHDKASDILEHFRPAKFAASDLGCEKSKLTFLLSIRIKMPTTEQPRKAATEKPRVPDGTL